MARRYLISILVIIAVIAAAGAAAMYIFSSQYDTLLMLESTDASSAESEQETLADLTVKAEEAAEANPEQEESAFEGTDVSLITGQASDTAITTDANVTSDAASQKARSMVSSMTLTEKICQMMIVSPEALTGYSRVIQTGDVSRNAYSMYPVGGIVYDSENMVSQDQVREMVTALQSYALETTGYGLFTCVSEEGGADSVCASSLGTSSFDDMRTIGDSGDVTRARAVGSTQAEELTALGFNLNLAPCADVITNDSNTRDSETSFGSDPEQVASMVAQVVTGLQEGGMLSAVKYFPGYGSTGTETSGGFPSSDSTYEDLQACDLVPFQAAISAGAPAIMVGHVMLTQLDDQYPASLSPTIVTGILRNDMGYNGIIMTESLSSGALPIYYTNADAAVQAISAGCDMLLGVTSVSSVLNAVTAAVENGTVQESQLDASCIRILSAKIRYGIIPG